jgi:hypothetical protein
VKVSSYASLLKPEQQTERILNGNPLSIHPGGPSTRNDATPRGKYGTSKKEESSQNSHHAG